jgi:hypothetical protein
MNKIVYKRSVGSPTQHEAEINGHHVRIVKSPPKGAGGFGLYIDRGSRIHCYTFAEAKAEALRLTQEA